MDKEHYLDNAATTPLSPGVLDLIETVLRDVYGNPSSLHRKGQEAEAYLKRAREQVAKVLMAPPEAIYFTSCATESINSALKGAARRMGKRGRHILTGTGEHAATVETLKALEDQGFEVEEIGCDKEGTTSLESLEKKLRPDTILVTSMQVNNETGCLQPVEDMARIIKKYNPDILFHVDATQGFAKYPLFPESCGIDLLSASGHKINGPKGIGFLYMRRGLHLPELILGGGQEGHFRSGTENVAYIAGLGEAAQQMWDDHAAITSRMMRLKLDFVRELLETVPQIHVNGPAVDKAAAHIVNLQVENVRSEVLLHALEDENVFISSGSACSSNHPERKSRPLAAIGKSPKEIDESFRVSLGRFTTKEDMDSCLHALQKEIPLLRRFVRR